MMGLLYNSIGVRMEVAEVCMSAESLQKLKDNIQKLNKNALEKLNPPFESQNPDLKPIEIYIWLC